ncbi:hypothetical protein PV10_08544 [Exophiala mesophila]|uniref:Acyltransferase 3 domain-containing protein n=1 Tax=Exophiala mesophila TaxID=212818 RepID=A0A0D1WJ50_EXOME|nr:uncharacterized protein PV10_08544 [Exophiala mesophila]KIV88915.1 hypothetical protein PV10_08544 [Exophiala mesophila]
MSLPAGPVETTAMTPMIEPDEQDSYSDQISSLEDELDEKLDPGIHDSQDPDIISTTTLIQGVDNTLSISSGDDDTETTPLVVQHFDYDEYEDEEEDLDVPQPIALPTQDLSRWQRVKHTLRPYIPSWKSLLPTYIITSRISSAGDRPTAYLDALRGYAAFVVYISHLWYIFMQDTWRRYPFVSTLFSGVGSVSLFYIISGYALGHGLLLEMHRMDHARMLHRLASLSFRRYLRLYGSCVAAFIIAFFLVRLRIYNGVDIKIHQDSILAQLRHWFTDVFRFCNPFAPGINDIVFNGSIGSDYLPQLWTIPVEFRGSLFLFFFCTAILRLTTRTRMILMWVVMIVSYCWQAVYIAEFTAGLFIAQLSICRNPQRLLLPTTTTTMTESSSERPARKKQSWPAKILHFFLFIIGFILLGEVDFGRADLRLWGPFPWRYLNKVIPFWWIDKAEYLFWLGIGGFMLVYALEFGSGLQKPLKWTVSRYLGDISFGLYAMHLPFGRGIKELYLDPWRESHLGDSYWAHAFVTIVITFIVITAADYFTRIDRFVIRSGKRLQGRMFTKW